MSMGARALFAAAMLFAAPAIAINMSRFEDAPITRLNEEELKAYRAFIMKAIDTGAEGTTVEWNSTGTKFNGKVTPGKRFQDGKDVCREAGIESDSGDRHMRGRYTFCKDAAGIWQLKSPTGKGRGK